MKKLVLIGAGHAHMVTMANIDVIQNQGHLVTVIGPDPHHYYSGMGPGMLGTTYTPADIRFNTKENVESQGGTFIQDKVCRIDPATKELQLASGDKISYDVLSCNAGSYVDRTMIKGDDTDIFSVKPIATLLAAQARLVSLAQEEEPSKVAIVGGGPSSCEIAGNILQLTSAHGLTPPAIHIFCRHKFMGRFARRIRRLAMDSLLERGVFFHEGCQVTSINKGQIHLANGPTAKADIIFLATGVKPSPIFADSGLTIGPEQGLLVNRFLQCPAHPDIFGGGDCIYFADSPLDKVGVYAVRQNQVLYHNLLAALNNTPLTPFKPGGKYLLIFNLGQGQGLLHKGWFTFSGRVAFFLKDYIDRKFMARFQSNDW